MLLNSNVLRVGRHDVGSDGRLSNQMRRRNPTSSGCQPCTLLERVPAPAINSQLLSRRTLILVDVRLGSNNAMIQKSGRFFSLHPRFGEPGYMLLLVAL